MPAQARAVLHDSHHSTVMVAGTFALVAVGDPFARGEREGDVRLASKFREFENPHFMKSHPSQRNTREGSSYAIFVGILPRVFPSKREPHVWKGIQQSSAMACERYALFLVGALVVMQVLVLDDDKSNSLTDF
eukprot:7012-Rhodomonas_salina.2